MDSTTTSYINLDYLKLMSGGDQEMEQTILVMLLDELPTEFEKMKTLHKEENWAELGNVSHKMKSTLAFIGNDILTEANSKIETYSKNEENLEEVDHLMLTFEEILPSIMDALRSLPSHP